MNYQGFSLQTEGEAPSPVVYLNLPSKPLTGADLRQFEDLLDQVEEGDSRTLVVLRGEKEFCLGLSFAELHTSLDKAERTVSLAEKTLRTFSKLANPKLALITGTCRGWGATLALGCDFCLMHRQAQLIWDELAHGLTPGIATWLLPQLVGLGRARRILLSGQPLTADEALSLGIAFALFEEDGDASAQIKTTAEYVKQLSPTAFQATRKLLREAWGSNYTDFVGTCLASQAMCLSHLNS